MVDSINDQRRMRSMSTGYIKDNKLESKGTWSELTKQGVMDQVSTLESNVKQLEIDLAQAKSLIESKSEAIPVARVERRSLRLDSNTLKYGGLLTENLQEWQQLIVAACKAAGIEENGPDALWAITPYTYGAARRALLKFVRETKDDSRY